MKMGFSLELCHESLLCSHWESSHHSYEEDVPSRVFDCSLLSSCDHQYIGNTTYPTVTNAGTRICLPDPFKRRPCSACPGKKKGERRFCHGRCPYNNSPGAKCLFGVCSASPYREDPGSTCSQLAMEAQEEECSGPCEDISTNTGADSCQSCLEDNIDPSCQDVSGAACWFCGRSILEKLEQCATVPPAAAALDTINCISQAILPSCRSCVCTLLCYWSPTDDLCTSCVNQPQLASLFLHHQQCPQGWVYSATSSSCLKAFNQMKPWNFSKSFCENGGGVLAQPKSTLTIQTALEAINLLGVGGMFWLGPQEIGDIMSQNFPSNYPDDYVEVFIESGTSISKHIIHNLDSGMAVGSSKWI